MASLSTNDNVENISEKHVEFTLQFIRRDSKKKPYQIIRRKDGARTHILIYLTFQDYLLLATNPEEHPRISEKIRKNFKNMEEEKDFFDFFGDFDELSKDIRKQLHEDCMISQEDLDEDPKQIRKFLRQRERKLERQADKKGRKVSAEEWEKVRSPEKEVQQSSIPPERDPCVYCKSTKCDGTWEGYKKYHSIRGKNETKRERKKWMKKCKSKQPKAESSSPSGKRKRKKSSSVSAGESKEDTDSKKSKKN